METSVFIPCYVFALSVALYSASSKFDRAVLSRSTEPRIEPFGISEQLNYLLSNERLNTRTYEYLSNLLNVLKSTETYLIHVFNTELHTWYSVTHTANFCYNYLISLLTNFNPTNHTNTLLNPIHHLQSKIFNT